MIILSLSLTKGEASPPEAGKPASGGQGEGFYIFRNNVLIIHEPSLHLSLTKGEKQWKHYF